MTNIHDQLTINDKPSRESTTKGILSKHIITKINLNKQKSLLIITYCECFCMNRKPSFLYTIFYFIPFSLA